MAFNAGRGKIKTKQVSNSNNNRKWATDLLLEVTEIVAGPKNTGYIQGVNDNGTIFRVHISDEHYAREEENFQRRLKDGSIKDYKFAGHNIDEDMKNELTPKKGKTRKIMATQAYYQVQKTIDGEKINFFEARYIENIPQISKLKRGIISAVTGYFDREKEAFKINTLGCWNEKAIKISDTEKLEELAKDIDNCLEAIENEDFSKLLKGIMFATAIVNPDAKDVKSDQDDKKTGPRPLKWVNCSNKFDYVPKYIDEETQEEFEGFNITGEFLLEQSKQYAEYIEQHEELHKKYPDAEFVPHVIYFDRYPFSNFVNSFTEKQTGSPLYQMLLATTGLGVGEEDKINGLFGGIMYFYISPDKLEDGEHIVKNWINRLYSNVYKTNILEYIRPDIFDAETDEEHRKLNMASVDTEMATVFYNKDSTLSDKMLDKPEEADAYHDEEPENDSNNGFESEQPSQSKQEAAAPATVDDVDDDIPF